MERGGRLPSQAGPRFLRPSIALTLLVAAAPWPYGSSGDVARYGLAAALLAIAAAWFWTSPPLASAVLRPAGGLAAFAVLQALALSRAPVSSVESLMVLAACLAVIVVAAHDARDEGAARRLAYGVLATCGAQAVFGVIQAAATPRRVYGAALAEIQSPYGSFLNHNHFAGLVEMGAVLALALAIGGLKRAGGVEPRSILLFGLGLALAGAHLASRSRGGLLALFTGAVLLVPLWWLASSRGGRRRSTLLAGAAMLVVLAFGLLAIPAASRAHLATLVRGAGEASGRYRLSAWGATLRLWTTHPMVGSGLGTYADAVTRFKQSDGLVRTTHAENDLLEFTAEGGLVGLALIGWLAAVVFRGFLDRVREGHDPWRKGLAVGAVAAVAGLLAHSLVDFNLRIPSNALAFSALVGLAAAPRREPKTISRGLARVLAVGLAVLAIAAVWRTVGATELAAARSAGTAHERLARLDGMVMRHPYLAEAWRLRAHMQWALARGGDEVRRFRLEGAEHDVRRALALRPLWCYAWSDLGWVLYMQGDVVAAERALRRAIELDPVDVGIGQALAELLFRLGRHDEGREALLRVRRYNPDWPAAAAEAAASRWKAGPRE